MICAGRKWPDMVPAGVAVICFLSSTPAISTCVDLFSSRVQHVTGMYLMHVWSQLIISSVGMPSIEATVQKVRQELCFQVIKLCKSCCSVLNKSHSVEQPLHQSFVRLMLPPFSASRLASLTKTMSLAAATGMAVLTIRQNSSDPARTTLLGHPGLCQEARACLFLAAWTQILLWIVSPRTPSPTHGPYFPLSQEIPSSVLEMQRHHSLLCT